MSSLVRSREDVKDLMVTLGSVTVISLKGDVFLTMSKAVDRPILSLSELVT